MAKVILAEAADSPGYTRLTLAEPIGAAAADALVTAKAGELEQTLYIAGQREFDVLEGATVTFPDGTTWDPIIPADQAPPAAPEPGPLAL